MNKDILASLAGLYAAGKLAHAYLFTGPKGIGKHETALALAQRVNCLQGGPDPAACDCASCRRIAGGNHPDVVLVQKPGDKAGISIDQVRAVIGRLEFRALEARVKFAIIQDAESINPEAANAFLKTLEEPRPGTVLVLTTSTPDALLGTIRSRCQMVRFPAMSTASLARSLREQNGSAMDDAIVLAAFGQGSPGRAVELGEDFLLRRRTVLDAFLGPGDTEQFLKVVGGEREQARERAREALHVVLMVLRDALLIKSGAADKAVNCDRRPEIERFTARWTPQELSAHVDRVTDAIRRVDGNQNVKVVLTVVRDLMN